MNFYKFDFIANYDKWTDEYLKNYKETAIAAAKECPDYDIGKLLEIDDELTRQLIRDDIIVVRESKPPYICWNNNFYKPEKTFSTIFEQRTVNRKLEKLGESLEKNKIENVVKFFAARLNEVEDSLYNIVSMLMEKRN